MVEEKDQTSVSDEETLTDEETVGEGEEDYKTKFSESSKEAMRLLEANKILETKIKEVEETHQKRLDEIAKLNPEKVELSGVKESLTKVEKELNLEKDLRVISDFVKQNPEADAHRDVLKDFKGFYPNLTVLQIWNEKVKPIIEKGAQKKIEDIHEKEAGQPETGEGSATGEPGGGGMTPAQFNKLPLDKQKSYLKKLGL